MSLVQAVGFSNDQTSATVNVAISATGVGNALILMLVNYIDTKNVASFVCGALTSSTPDFTFTDSNDNCRIQYFSIANVASGNTSAAVNMSAAGFLAGFIIEESGLLSSGIFDKSGSNYQTGATSWTSNNTAATAQSSEVAYGACFVPAVVAGSTYGTLGVGWTALSGTGITSGVSSEATAGLSLLGARSVLSSIGTPSFSATSSTNDSYAALIGTYKVAGGGSGATIAPSPCAATFGANAPTTVQGTVIQVPQAFRRKIEVPLRRISLPPWRKAA